MENTVANHGFADNQVDGKADEAAADGGDDTTATDTGKQLVSEFLNLGNSGGGSLSAEPNPFEQSFGGAPQDAPGSGTKLPSVAALTSPSTLLPGGTPFPWGSNSSLRGGVLSPVMLGAPVGDYFEDAPQLRVGFPTPNESGMRSGLTPGGSGSMFPPASPSPGPMYGGTTTPGLLDFQRTALAAAMARQHDRDRPNAKVTLELRPPPAPTSQPLETISGGQLGKAASKFDPHDNDAANGLFMLAQGRGGTQPPAAAQTVTAYPPIETNGTVTLAGSSVGGVSETTPVADEAAETRPNTRAKGKKRNSANQATTSRRRKAESPPVKAQPAKRARASSADASVNSQNSDESEESDAGREEGQANGKKKKKLTDARRKEFLERNRYAAWKCRQRKKQWVAELVQKAENLSQHNEQLQTLVANLQEEVVGLKTILMAHKDCPVTQRGVGAALFNQMQVAVGAAAAPYNNPLNAFTLQQQMPSQSVMPGAPMPGPSVPGQPMDQRFP